MFSDLPQALTLSGGAPYEPGQYQLRFLYGSGARAEFIVEPTIGSQVYAEPAPTQPDHESRNLMAADILSNAQHVLVLSVEPKSESVESVAQVAARTKLRLIAPFVRIDAASRSLPPTVFNRPPPSSE